MEFIPTSSNKSIMVDENKDVVNPYTLNYISIKTPTFSDVKITEISNDISESSASYYALATSKSTYLYTFKRAFGSNSIYNKILEYIFGLKASKANSGALHFNKGSVYTISATNVSIFPISFACKINGNWNDLSTNGFFVFTNCKAVTQGTAIRLRKSNDKIRVFVYYYDQNGKTSSSYADFEVPAKNDVILAVAIKNSWLSGVTGRLNVSISFNGIQKTGTVSGTSATTLQYTSNNGYALNVTKASMSDLGNAISRFLVSMSDVCLFNFDITSEDALYTIEDYHQGKPIPPSLLCGYGDYTTSSSWASRWGNANIVTSTSSITATTTKEENSTYISIVLPEQSFTQGQVIEVSYDNITSDVELTNPLFYITNTVISYKTMTSNKLVVVVEKSGNGQFEFSFKTKNEPIPNGTTFIVNGLTIKVSGAILALENYTINRKILDYSGNKNHATVIGSVMGDNDTRIESFVEEITTTTSEQN